MKSIRFCLAVTLMITAFNSVAKEATSTGANRPLADTNKREQNNGIPQLDSDWKRYLRWHRDAMALREREDGTNANNRHLFLQL